MKENIRLSLFVPRQAALAGAALPVVGALLFGALVVLALGCAAFDASRSPDASAVGGPASPGGGDQLVVRTEGLQPDWDLDTMVRRSDAVVVATVRETLDTSQYPGPSSGGETPKYNEEFRNHRLTIETAYHPASLSGDVAVMTGPYPVQSDPNISVAVQDQIPEFAVGDRVLVFLDSLDDPVYSDGPVKTAPDGYTKARYYRPIIGSYYGKLMVVGLHWSDTRSHKSVSENQVTEAVARQKGGGG